MEKQEIAQPAEPVKTFPTLWLNEDDFQQGKAIDYGDKVTLICDYDVIRIDENGVEMKLDTILPQVKGRKV